MFQIAKTKEQKKNVVVWLIDAKNRFINDIKKTNTISRIEKMDMENKLMEQEIKNFFRIMEHAKNEAKLSYWGSLKKSSIAQNLVHLLGCICSLLLTPLGFGLITLILTNHKKLSDGLGGDNEVELYVQFVITIIITVIITVIQIKGFYYASIYNQIDKYFHKSAFLAKLITIIIIPVSIAGNFNMLYKVMKFTNNPFVDVPIVMFICISLDFSVILGFRLKHDKKYKNYQIKEEVEQQESDRLTLWNMIKTFTIDFLKSKMMGRFYDMRNDIDSIFRKYNQVKPVPKNSSVDENSPFGNDANVVSFPINNTNTTERSRSVVGNPDEAEDDEYSIKERDNYLKFIIKNRKGPSIPSNTVVLKAKANKNIGALINLNNTKIQKIRKELYNCEILVEPLKANAKTKFTNKFFKIINDDNFDEKNIPNLMNQLSEKYKDLDKQNKNNLDKKENEAEDSL